MEYSLDFIINDFIEHEMKSYEDFESDIVEDAIESLIVDSNLDHNVSKKQKDFRNEGDPGKKEIWRSLLIEVYEGMDEDELRKNHRSSYSMRYDG